MSIKSEAARKLIADVIERNAQHNGNLRTFLSNAVTTTPQFDATCIMAVRDGMRESANRLTKAIKAIEREAER